MDRDNAVVEFADNALVLSLHPWGLHALLQHAGLIDGADDAQTLRIGFPNESHRQTPM
jgi:hypothetical protein